jgi:hypothetical protein
MKLSLKLISRYQPRNFAKPKMRVRPEQLLRKLAVNGRDDRLVVEKVKVLAILIDDHYSQRAQMIAPR